jgi:hypothetical protein
MCSPWCSAVGRPQRSRIWLFDYGVHRCAALACFTLTDAACTTPPRQRSCGWHPSVLQAASSHVSPKSSSGEEPAAGRSCVSKDDGP